MMWHRPSKVEKMVFSWGISHFLAQVIRSNVFYIPQHNRDGKNLLLIKYQISNIKYNFFLATLVALHFTPVSESVSKWVVVSD